MKLADLQKMADRLFIEHELDGWTFQFDNAVKRFGQCRRYEKVISMSRKLVEANTEERCRLTLLHEIAHALAPIHEGHGRIWKRICREIGGDGQARYSLANTAQPQMRFYTTCCGNTWQRARRVQPYRVYMCPKCRNQLQWLER